MSATEEFWSGTFGREYTERNRVNWRARSGFWCDMIAMTQPDDVLEVGCNAGWNLRAIREVSPGTMLRGVEINTKAASDAKRAGFEIHRLAARVLYELGAEFDLVFTAGMLIHVPPDELEVTMRRIVDRSRRHVLAIEYDADAEEEVEYRGHAGRLWKRPFGRLYEAMGLKPIADGVADGFDRCHWWLLEKP